MDPIFQNAATATPPVVMGLQLLPFSLGHSIILEAIEHPAVTGDSALDMDALALGVAVCSKDYETGREIFIGNPEIWLNDAPRWARKFRGKKSDWWAAQANAWDEYLIDYNTIPEVWEPGAGDGDGEAPPDLAAPWQFHIIRALGRDGLLRGIQYGPTAWDVPLNMAYCLYCTIGEAKDRLDVMTEEDRRAVELLNSDDPEIQRLLNPAGAE